MLSSNVKKISHVARFIKHITLFSIVLGMGTAHCFGEEESNWKIGGKIHFEEQGLGDYLGTVEINKITREALKTCFAVKNDCCAPNAKVLIKKENGDFFITHYEEKSRPGIGEEMHATLLYTKKIESNGHETLRDICENLAQVDENLSCEKAPTVEQVAKAYHKIIKPDWKFEISDVVLITGKTANVIVVELLFEGRKEILNKEGNPISSGFLHMTLVNVDSSVASGTEKINCAVSKLREKLSGKMIKIANRNGQADLEFGVSGSKNRIRP